MEVSVADPEFPRVGFLYDEDESTPHIPATFDFSQAKGIRLSLPFAPDYGLEYAHWFTESAGCPPYLKFVDTSATLHLINCRSAGHRGFVGSDAATGLLTADFAIEDPSRDKAEFDRVHTLRSRIAGLHDFTGWRLSDVDYEANDDGSLREAVIRTRTPLPVTAGSTNNLVASLIPNWRSDSPERHKTSLSENTYFETKSERPISMEEHLAVHSQARDLLAMAGWSTLDFLEHLVQRTDNPERVLSGQAIGPAWRRIYTTRTLRAHHLGREVPKDQFPIASPFHLEAIGPGAVASWLTLGSEWQRVVRPLLQLLFSSGSSIEVALLQAGVSIEAYGFLAAMAAGSTTRDARALTFSQRIRGAADTLPVNLEAMVGNLDGWVERANRAYRAVKHADRALPEPQEALVVAHTFIIIVRLHLMRGIGVGSEVIQAYQRHADWHNLERQYKDLGFHQG